MICQIHIRDFAIIDTLELELSSGTTVLTGETGAGKSILIDALGLVLGDRADSSVVRHGAKKAEIHVTFALSNAEVVKQWLDEQDITYEDTCILRRSITCDGKSRAWINGVPTSLQTLKALSEKLVDIHGQHAHQSLLRRDAQRQIVDDFAAHKHLLSAVAQAYQHWRDLDERLHTLQEHDEQHHARVELLSFQVQELEALGTSVEEIQQLDTEHVRLAHAQDLLQTAQNAYTTLYLGESSVDVTLHKLCNELATMAQLDQRLAEVLQTLAETHIQITESARTLNRYAEAVELDPARLQWVEQRLAEIHSLARKYRLPPEQLPARLVAMQAELASLAKEREDLATLAQQLAQASKAYQQAATALSQSRSTHAKQLSEAISQAMQELGMVGGSLQIVVQEHAKEQFSPLGQDQVLFTVSANPGQPLQALHKVASGGELSRISLAIQMVAAHALPINTLIFDEVDSGIGGAVAEIVGRQLHRLGAQRQVLCVTHLPQVAALGHQHLLVCKSVATDRTRTEIRSLNDEERVHEIARMLGGVAITPHTLAHAREMRDQSKGEDNTKD